MNFNENGARSPRKDFEMKSMSTGFGLAILGAGIFGASVVSSPQFNHTASAQSANGAKAITTGGATGAQPIQESLAQMINRNGTRPRIETCGDSLEWFSSQLRPLTGCDANAFQYSGVGEGSSYPWIFTPVDINGDGIMEFLAQGGWDLNVSSQCLLLSSRIEMVSGEAEEHIDCIVGQEIRAECINAINAQSNGGFDSASVFLSFRDIDGDGDLDLVLSLGWATTDDEGSQQFHNAYMWSENTGFQNTQSACASDLDHSGEVDSGDVGLVLLDFGPCS